MNGANISQTWPGANPVSLAGNAYNAEGKRVSRVESNGAETRFYYMGDALLFTTNGAYLLETENILDLSGEIIASRRFDFLAGQPNDYFFYNYDARGSVSNIVNNAGNRVKGYDYDEYGNLSGSSGNFKNEVTYTGYVSDNVTGLYYANSRYYNPATGRFLTQDAYTGNAGEPWTQNLYTYCGNNPINFIDPTGHCRKSPRMGRKLDCHDTFCSKSSANKAERISPKGSPIIIKKYGNTIYIDAYVEVTGKGIDKELVKYGIEKHWTTTPDKYRVFTRVRDSRSPDDSRLTIHTKGVEGISNAGWKQNSPWNTWDGKYVGRITLHTAYPGHPARNKAELMRLAAHEIGHVFGLWGNAKPGGEDPRDTYTIMGSKMWEVDDLNRAFGVVTAVNIEKMLVAQRTGIPN